MAIESIKNSRYFRLFPDVIHFPGNSSKGVLYLLSEKKTIKLGEISNKIVGKVEGNLPLSQVARHLGIPESSLEEVLKGLEKTGAGCFMDSPCFVEKIRQPDLTSDLILSTNPPVVNSFRITLTNRCHQDCIFCRPPDFGKRLRPCIGCRRGSGKDEYTLSVKQIQKALHEISQLDCKLLALCAGDPALVVDLTVKSIVSAYDQGFDAVEYVTGTALPDTLLGYFIEHHVTPTFQIFSPREASHDRVFGKKGGFSRLMDNIDILKKANRAFNFYFLYPGDDSDPIDCIEKLKELNPGLIYCDRLANNFPVDTGFLFGESNLISPEAGLYAKWLGKRRCLNSILTLNSDGNYHFCPALLDEKIGNVDATTLQEIYAHLDNDGAEAGCVTEDIRCAGCEYNPACHICKAPNGNAGTTVSICGYEPREGVWLPTVSPQSS